MIHFPKPDVEQYFQTYFIRTIAVSHDEKRIIFNSNLNGQPNVWSLDIDKGYPVPLTYHNQNCSFLTIAKDKPFILVGFDHDGNENYHIYALKPDGGTPYPLIQGDTKDRYDFSHLSEDGERLYYVTTAGNPSYLNTRLLNIREGTDEILHTGEEVTTFLEAVSPNEEQFVYSKQYSNTYCIGYLQKGDELIPLTSNPEHDQRMTQFTFIDDNHLFYATDLDSPNMYVAQYNISTGETKPLCYIPNEDVTVLTWDKSSRTLYILTDKGIEDRLYAYKLDSEEMKPIELPTDVIEQVIVKESGNVYVSGRGALDPHNIYRLKDGKWDALTHNVVTGLTRDDLVYPEAVRYNSFDGLEIEALLFRAKPENANGNTVFWPHGGPQASEGKFFRPMFQFILANGYHIFAPNFRGSTGYGSAFSKMVEGDWGEGPRLDCVAGMDWLFAEGISDPDQLFIVGGSYGGYMTLLLSGRHPEYFRAAVDIFGPCNLFTFLESVPEDWKPMMSRWLGEPERDRERLIRDSPITYLDQMVKPLLVIQGANDPRVVKAESDQIVAALEQNGTEVEYIVLDDEGHGFSRRSNETLVYRKMLEFLNKHRLPESQ